MFRMSSDTREEQIAEIEALKSVYDDSHVSIDDGPSVGGRISIELEPLAKHVTIVANTEEVENSRISGTRFELENLMASRIPEFHSSRYSTNLTTLSPVNLVFRLPSEYPMVSPHLEIECEWMDDSMVSTIRQRLSDVCREHIGMGVLYFCCETVVTIVKEVFNELSEICLDNTPYGKKHNLTGLQLFHRVADSSEQSEDLHFQSGCYDCEICFENKMGSHCVQFHPCKHVFCKDCVSEFFRQRLYCSEVKALGCPATSCQSLASQKTVRSLLGEDEFERYDRIILSRALEQMADVVPCPRKTCQNPVVVSERTLNLGTCTVCGLSFCVLCFRAYHGVDGCNFKTMDKQRILKQWNSANEKERAFMARRFGGLKNLQKLIDTMLNEGWIDGNSKPCPRCRVNIEKNEGCNKMQCSKCDAMFCWLCNKILDKNSPYGHFNEDGGSCANRLFEGITASDSDEDEDGDVNWVDFLQNDNDIDTDSDIEIIFEENV